MLRPNFSPSDRADVDRVLDELLPSVENRRAVAELVARAVEAMHSVQPRGYGITVRPRRMTLNFPTGALLIVDRTQAQLIVTDFDEPPPEGLEIVELPGFKRFPESKFLSVPPERMGELLLWARTGVDRLIEIESSRGALCSDRDTHSPAAIDYFARLVARPIAQPDTRYDWHDFTGTDDEPDVWKIAPGEDAELWPQWVAESCAAIGWNSLGDVTALDREQVEERRLQLASSASAMSAHAARQVWRFANFPVGTILVANRGTHQVLGIGRIVGPYEYVPGNDQAHRREVDWFDVSAREVEKPGWRRTLVQLGTRFLDALGVEWKQPGSLAGPWLGRQASDLFLRLASTPSKATYDENKVSYQREIEQPFRQLFARIARLLPERIRSVCETESNLVARLLKNDYGRGGAYDYLWGAFYPRGGRRVAGAQLFVWANAEDVRVGFGFPTDDEREAAEYRMRLSRDAQSLSQSIPMQVGGHDLEFGDYGDAVRPVAQDVRPGVEGFLHVAREGRLSIARLHIDWKTQLNMSRAQFETLVVECFEAVFPLFELAMDAGESRRQPVTGTSGQTPPSVEDRDFAPPSESALPQPRYGIEQLTADTSLPSGMLREWLRALDRKGQAVLYGPPGTGKTFLAERIARHLVSDSDGLVETVQFHPAYGYEDFVQGIRPSTVSGSVSYDLRDGCFVDFCKRAESRSGTSVLIVDEINRANLPRVFGELMYLLEYRDKEVRLASGEAFRIPPRVRVLGTMNTADRSIALVDHALRRRFAFLKLEPQFDVLREFHRGSGLPIERWIAVLESANTRIGDPNYAIGISYFLRRDLGDHIESIWRHEILPYLDEFFFDDRTALAEFQWERVAGTVRE